jgi:hypothetical protein
MLFALAPLMPCFGKQLAMFVFAHFFPPLFYDTAQQITSLTLFSAD